MISGTNRLQTATGSEPGTYTCDSNGNMTGDGTHTYEYSQRNRLATVDSGATGTYSYDGDGRRVKKTARGAAAVFFCDPSGKLIEEYTPSSGANEDYLWLPGTYEPLARVDYTPGGTTQDLDTGNVLQ